MAANASISVSSSKSPCGCGGSGAAPASPCNCGGGGGCSSCQGQSYVRPLFFAGQLLTEDDLQSLGDYVVAKNRLHNRFLMGSGVVCGLQVTCPPCGCGTVVVNPGYAIDCCGNDIAVACPQTLDINQMVRNLLLKLRGGTDCSDPCAGTTATSGTSQSASAAMSGANSGMAGNAATQKPDPSRRYCLYINYCEQPSDPVSPYATDAPCGSGTCEPTRIREGFTFELRCPPTSEPDPAICSCFWNCVGDPTALQKATIDCSFLCRYAQRLAAAVLEIGNNPALTITDPAAFSRRLREHTEELEHALDEAKIEGEHIDAAIVDAILEKVSHLAANVARYSLQPVEIRRESDKSVSSLGSAITLLGTAHKTINASIIRRAFPTTLRRGYAAALMEVTGQLAGAHSSRDTSERVLVAPEFKTMTMKFMAVGVAYTPAFHVLLAESLQSLKQWLQNLLQQSQGLTICNLLAEVDAVVLPSTAPATDTSMSGATSIVSAEGVLCRIVQQYLRNCFCNALLPACPPCDDPGVLLACLTVKDCRVKDICNLEREFVISPAAVRYWIPEIQRMGDAIEKWCCPSRYEKCENEKRGYQSEFLSGALGQAPAYAELALAMIAGACPAPVQAEQAQVKPLSFLAPLVSKWRLAEEKLEQDAAAESANAATAALERRVSELAEELKDLSAEHAKLQGQFAKEKKSRSQES
jgi:hypothetical protein